MPSRAFWKGYLKLSLVTCAVSMTPATTEGGKVRFHTLNRKTGDRVESRYVDPETGKFVDEDDEAKGYQTGPDQFTIIEDDELDAVALESTHTIDIDMFTPKESIGWIWYDKPHFLAPDDKIAEEAFSVIRDALRATGTFGISRLVLYRRERAVMLEPRDEGIVLWTLRYGDEVRDAGPYFEGIKKDKADARLMSLVTKLIDERTRRWDASMVEDLVQDRLLEIIAAKQKGKRAVKRQPAPERPSNVIDIMDALKKSIAADKKREKRS